MRYPARIWITATSMVAMGLAVAAWKGRTEGQAPDLAVSGVAEGIALLPPGNRMCDDHIAKDRDKKNVRLVRDQDTLRLRLFQTKEQWDASHKNLGRGQWVGAIENVEHTPSKLLPEGWLEGDDWGCVLFITYRDNADTVRADAYFHVRKYPDLLPRKFPIAMYCVTETHKKGAEPDWLEVAKNCKAAHVTVQTNVGVVSLIVLPSGGRDSVEVADITEALGKELARKQLPDPSIAVLLQRVGGEGPWFPCAQTGCCRAS